MNRADKLDLLQRKVVQDLKDKFKAEDEHFYYRLWLQLHLDSVSPRQINTIYLKMRDNLKRYWK